MLLILFDCFQVSEELLWELFVQAGPVGMYLIEACFGHLDDCIPVCESS